MKKGIVMAVALSILFNSLYALASAEELPLFASDADESAFGESLDIASDEGEIPAFVQTVEMAMGDMAAGEGAAGDGLKTGGAGEAEGAEKVEEIEKTGEAEKTEEMEKPEGTREKDGEIIAFAEGEVKLYRPDDNAKYILYYIEDSEGVVITMCVGTELAYYSGEGDVGEVRVPSEINNNTVYRIEEYAFLYCSDCIGSLVLPACLEEIGEYAFAGCERFRGNLILPEGLKEIGKGAFSGCYGFTGELELPKNLTKIGDSAFYGCKGFTGELKLPENLTEIGEYTFDLCSGFSGSLVLPQGVTCIGDYAFCGCGFTGELKLPKNLTEIGDYAFRGCGFTGELKIPEGLREVGEGAFVYCTGFTGNLELPDSLTRMGTGAFWECSGFTGDLKLPDSLTKIEEATFYNCSGFNGKLTLPANLTEIGALAFSGDLSSGWQSCHFVGDLELPSNLTKIGVAAFMGCKGFTGSLKFPEGLTEIEEGAFNQCTGFKGNLELPNSLKLIGEDAFQAGRFTGNLNLPENLTTIGKEAFAGCYGFSGDLVIPGSVESIGSLAFRGCNSLSRDIYMTANVRNIENDEKGMSAFEPRYDMITKEKIANADITIHAPRGSYAEAYAIENGYSYTDDNGYVHKGTGGTSSPKPGEGDDNDSDKNDSEDNDADNNPDNDPDNEEDNPDNGTDGGEDSPKLPPSTAPVENTTTLEIILTTPLSTANSAAAVKNDEYLQVGVYGYVGENARELLSSTAEGAGARVASIFDIILQVMAQNGAPLREVKELNAPLTFTIAAPEGVDGNVYDFAVLRIHDGQIAVLPDLDSDADTITFASDRFSAHAVVYGAKGSFTASRAARDSVPKTGDKLPPVAASAIITLVLAAMAVVFGRKELSGKAEKTWG